jgi:hypothetical protein
MSGVRFPGRRLLGCRFPGSRFLKRLGLAAALLAALAGRSEARELDVGPGKAYAAPSDAAAVARDGDTVNIAPGIYYDCAMWHASGLTIAGTGPDVRITDKACAGKAAFVIEGNNVVIRGLSFARVRVIDGNGAGIRAEGRDLTVEGTSFVNNQIGILAGGQGGSLRIADCTFSANGVSLDGQPTHSVLAGALDLLRIERSSFQDARGGDHVISSARRTELADDRLTDEGGHMSGPLVTVLGGSLMLDHSTVDLSRNAADRPGAILVAGDATAIAVSGNTLIEPEGDVPLLRNWTWVTATGTANIVPPNASAISDNGVLYHRLRSRIASLRSQLLDLKGVARHQVAQVARALKLIP